MEAGRELDALIAEKVMGWRCVDKEAADRSAGAFWENDTPCFYRSGISVVVMHKDGSSDGWRPSFDIAAAWLVVERFRQDGYLFALISDDREEPRDYAAEFRKYDSNIGETTYLNGQRASTAPLAICLAALDISF
jgi:hypothetical protein